MAGKFRNRNQKSKWEREDRLLDYIAAHKDEITRYLIVVLCSEVWRWVLDNVVFNLLPALQTFRTALIFLLWALPYFILSKLWVWKQKGDDPFNWCIQGMKFLLSIFAIALLCGLCRFLMNDFLHLGSALQIAVSHLIEEILYFFVMFKWIIQPEKYR